MLLNDAQLDELCELAKKAALRAGKIISKYQGQTLHIDTKQMGSSLASSVVTEVDLLCQEAILDTLKESIEKYDLGLLAEESKDDQSRFIKDYFWCIDPLDGTLPFTENREGYSVSIALVSNLGISEVSSIFDPVTNSLYSAIKNRGAFKNGIKLKVQDKCDLFNVYIHRSFLKHSKYDELIQLAGSMACDVGASKLNIVSHGGAAMNACWMIENAPSCYFAVPKKEVGGGNLWDYAASSLIVNESGGHASDFFGSPIELNRAESTYLNHRGILMASSSQIRDYFLSAL